MTKRNMAEMQELKRSQAVAQKKGEVKQSHEMLKRSVNEREGMFIDEVFWASSIFNSRYWSTVLNFKTWEDYLSSINLSKGRAERYLRIAKVVNWHKVPRDAVKAVGYTMMIQMLRLASKKINALNEGNINAWFGLAKHCKSTREFERIVDVVRDAQKAGLDLSKITLMPPSATAYKTGGIEQVRAEMIEFTQEKCGDDLKLEELTKKGSEPQPIIEDFKVEAPEATPFEGLKEAVDSEEVKPKSIRELASSASVANSGDFISADEAGPISGIEETRGGASVTVQQQQEFKITAYPEEIEVIREAIENIKAAEGISRDGTALELLAAEALSGMDSAMGNSSERNHYLAELLTKTHCRKSRGKFVFIDDPDNA